MLDGWIDVGHDAIVVLGILAFAISGAQLAVEKRMDLVGIAFLAVITATGGGMIRDVLIGRLPPAALVDVWMIGVALVGALVVFVLHRWLAHLSKPVLVFDAIGLGVFCVEGTVAALDHGLNPWSAAIAGMLTGVGGGMLRDVLANDVPAVFRRESRLYLLPALLGAGVTATLVVTGLATTWALIGVVLVVIAFRLLAERYGWRVPAPRTMAMPVVPRDDA